MEVQLNTHVIRNSAAKNYGHGPIGDRLWLELRTIQRVEKMASAAELQGRSRVCLSCLSNIAHRGIRWLSPQAIRWSIVLFMVIINSLVLSFVYRSCPHQCAGQPRGLSHCFLIGVWHRSRVFIFVTDDHRQC